MKTNIVKFTCLMVTLAIACIIGTGCSITKITSEREKAIVSIIVSPAANESTPNVSLAQDIVYDVSYSYSYRNVIVDDENPFVAVDGDLLHTNHDENLLDSNKKLDAQAYTSKFIASADDVTAVTAEKDVAKVLRIAADSINDLDCKKTVVLIDNGLSTSDNVAFIAIHKII